MNIADQFILALDLGTTAIKAGLFSLEGDLLKVETRPQQLIFKRDGFVEQSPYETWELAVNAVHALITGHKPQDIICISLSLQRGTVVPIRKNGDPATNLIVWMDKRGMPYVEEIVKAVGEERYYLISGHPITYINGAGKLLWLQQDTNPVWHDVEVVGPPETLFLEWLGCEDFVCSQSTGTYLFPTEIERKIWSVELARAIGFPIDKLPRQVSSVKVIGELGRRAAQEFGLKEGTPIVPGGGDGQCAAAGCGVLRPGLGLINIGTGAGVQTYLPHPVRDPKMVLNCAAHVEPSGWEMEGHTQASGAVFKWFRDEFGASEVALQEKSRLDAFDLLIQEAVVTPEGAEGLLCLPTFNGSTAPVIDQNSRGVLIGLNLSHTRNHVIRAFLEGISMEIRWMLDAIEATGADIDEIRLAGGGARNKHWNQIHANILGRPVSTLEVTDAALVGAAMCAGVGVGAYASLKEAAENFVKLKEIVEPQEEFTQTYGELYETYKRTFLLLSENRVFEKLRGKSL